MQINVFGSISVKSRKKIDTTSFLQKPYIRPSHIESNLLEYIDTRNQIKINQIKTSITPNQHQRTWFKVICWF